MDRERRGMAVLTAPPGPAPGRMAAWFGRPLASLPRMAAILALLAIAAACIWSVWATGRLIHADQQRSAALEAAQRAAPIKGATGDLGLYRAIDARMAQGQGYYHAAIAEHLAHDFPTKPFFTIRSPVLAEGTVLFGANGWRLIAITALALSLAGLIGLPPSVANTPERFAAALLLVLGGLGAFIDIAGLVHELIAGLLLSASLLFYRPGRWVPSLLLAAAALAVRELALPFLLLWLAFAMIERHRTQVLALLCVLGFFAVGMALHAQAVIALRQPGAPASPGWWGLDGPQAFLEGILRLTPLSVLPLALGAPLALLPLLGWIGLGGRLGWFAALWFGGFALAMAIFARPDNFYWGMMVLPAYGAGLAFVPRAILTLVDRARTPGQTG